MLTIGIDEAGRGSWAGPLVAAAVALAQPVDGLADSKQLRASRRQTLAEQIYQAATVGLGWVEPRIIDEVGLTEATSLAMAAACQDVFDQLANPGEIDIIIDGHINYLADLPGSRCFIKADATVPAVSAASIIAKTARDERMRVLAEQYPKYGFDKHVGYGTAFHLQQLKLHGISPLHRLSYRPIQAILESGL